MKWIAAALLCLICYTGFGQKRSALFKLDIKGNSFRLKANEFRVHVREVVDRALYANSSGSIDQAKYDLAYADRIDTMITFGPEFSFSLRNLNTGSTYSVSAFFPVQLDTFNKETIHRKRAVYQEFRINNWSYQYTIQPPAACTYDASLHNRTCPKCHKHDQVQPLIYDAADDTQEEGQVPRIIGREVGASITDCDPNWYCGRDKLSF